MASMASTAPMASRASTASTTKWRTKGWHLGHGKTALDAELFAISQALKMAVEQTQYSMIFTDSQSALDLIKEGQNLPSIVRDIWEDAEKLRIRGTPITLLWVPGHEGVEGNEKADQTAKRAAEGGKNTSPATSILYVKEQVTRWKRQQKHPFLPALQMAKKTLTARFLQLKCGHAAIGSYRRRFKQSDSAKCQWCGNENQDPTHTLLHCKKWKQQRRKLIKNLKEGKIFLSQRLNEKDTEKLFQKEAAKATLEFLTETKIGIIQGNDEWLDTWDLQLLDPGGGEEENEGEGEE